MEPFVVGMVFLGIPAIIGAIIKNYQAHHRMMKVLELKAEMNSRLLDRVGADPGAMELLKSEAQQHLFDAPFPEAGSRLPATQGRMLTSAQIGLVVLCAGAGLLYIRQFIGNSDDGEALLVIGTLGIALGVGALLSAVAAYIAMKLWQNDEMTSRSGAAR